jgi:predicted RNase H-like HicB family nuclease
MKRLEFKVEYSFDKETGMVTATVPELNYVSSFGETFEEAELNISEAVLAYLEALQRDNQPLPVSQLTSGTILALEFSA